MKRFPLLVVCVAAVCGTAPALAQTKPSTTGTTTPRTSTASGTISSTISGVERDLGIFRDWVNTQLDRADQVTQRELPRAKEEYERQSERIDRAADSLSAQSKREYGALKKRYETWEEEQARLEKQANQPQTAQQAQNKLLGENVNIKSARAAEMHDLYLRYIEAVRSQRANWTAEDWANASAVLTRLNQRYEQVRDQIPLEEKVHIRSWQAEFRTLETAKTVKSSL